MDGYMPSPKKKSTKSKSQKFEAVNDGHGGLILPDEAVEVLQAARRVTPVDKNFRQTPDMMIFEGCAGTVTKVSKGECTARLSQDGKRTITVEDPDAKVGDRVLNFSNEDGARSVVVPAQTAAKDFAEYNDGDSIIVSVVPTDEHSVGKLEFIHTVEKHVPYPRKVTIDGVEYPYVLIENDDTPYPLVKTSKGWTIGGKLAEAQHKENVALLKSEPVSTLVQ
jgi:hypothetical protein